MGKQIAIDERDFTITKELAYSIIKYGEKKIPEFGSKVASYIKTKFPDEDVETDSEFDWLLRNKMSDGDIETLLLKMG